MPPKRKKKADAEAGRPGFDFPVPVLSGLCSNGWCEGTQPISGRESLPTPRCKGLTISSVGGRRYEMMCTHDCHEQITEMYKIADLPRVWPETHYSPADEKLRTETGEVFDASGLRAIIEDSNARRIVVLDDDAHESVPALHEREEVTTLEGILPPNPHVEDPKRRDAGYRPRNQLLFDAKIAVDAWVLGAHPDVKVLNTSAIANLVNPKQPPSTGAVTNILRRWARVGFANIEEGPLRFVSYTKAGVKLGFDSLEDSYKATHASAAATKTKAQKAAMRDGVVRHRPR